MRQGLPLALAALFFSFPVFAEPPSDATIDELFQLTDVQHLVDGIRDQVSGGINNMDQQVLKGEKPNQEQQAVLDRMKAKMRLVLADELNWSNLRPMYIRLYKATFTEEDLQGALAFYRSAPGQAILKKMPALMQNVMTEMMTNYMPEVQKKMLQIQKETVEELRTIKSS